MLRSNSPIRPYQYKPPKKNVQLFKQIYNGISILFGQLSSYFGQKESKSIFLLVLNVLIREGYVSLNTFALLSRIDRGTYRGLRTALISNPKHKEATDLLSTTSQTIAGRWWILNHADRLQGANQLLSLMGVGIPIVAFSETSRSGYHSALCFLSAIFAELAFCIILFFTYRSFILLSPPEPLSQEKRSEVSREKDELVFYRTRLHIFAQQKTNSDNFFQEHERDHFLPHNLRPTTM